MPIANHPDDRCPHCGDTPPTFCCDERLDEERNETNAAVLPAFIARRSAENDAADARHALKTDADLNRASWEAGPEDEAERSW